MGRSRARRSAGAFRRKPAWAAGTPPSGPGTLGDRVDRIAAEAAFGSGRQAERSGEAGELGRERLARRHMEHGEPAVEREAERRRQTGLIAEIDDVKRPSRHEMPRRL